MSSFGTPLHIQGPEPQDVSKKGAVFAQPGEKD